MTEQDLQEAQDRLAIKGSPFLLGRHVFNYDRFCETQIKWDRWLRKRIDFGNPQPIKVLILQPRETFKTTYFGPCLTTTILLNDPNRSVLYAGEKYDNVVDLLGEVKGQYEENHKFRDHFGNWVKSHKWQSDKIIIQPRHRHRKEYSIFVAGKTSAVTGKHPDDIIADDIAGDEDRDSQASRDSTLIFFQRLFDLLSKQTGRLFVIGTRKHTKDIYYHIKENLNPELERAGLDRFHILETPAHKVINGERTTQLNFPTLLPEKKLQELRIVKVGHDATDFATYESEYELCPLDPKTAIFKVFHEYDHSTTKYKNFIMYTDPAISTDAKACYSAIIALGQIDGGQFDNRWGIPWWSIARREPSKVITDMIRIYRMFFAMYKDIPISNYMENNGFQQLMCNKAMEDSLKDGGVPVPVSGEPTKLNKKAKIRAIEPWVSQGFILVRNDWKEAPEGYRLGVEQLKQFPQVELDGPDVLAMAHRKSQEWYFASAGEPEKEEPKEEPKGEQDSGAEVSPITIG